jgi:hypothetical protein
VELLSENTRVGKEKSRDGNAVLLYKRKEME